MLKKFTYSVGGDRSISVQIHLVFDGITVIIGDIYLKSNYENEYPSNPQIKFYDKAYEYGFYHEYTVEKNGKVEKESLYQIDETIRNIIKEAFRIRDNT